MKADGHWHSGDESDTNGRSKDLVDALTRQDSTINAEILMRDEKLIDKFKKFRKNNLKNES